jgi:hypothetical protein
MPLKVDVWDLPQPVLEFGLNGEASDPKVGLAQYGPFSLRFGAAHKSQVRLGLVGPRQMLDQAQEWFERCQLPLLSGNDNKILHPDFPGFQQTFHSSLTLDDRWLMDLDAHIDPGGLNLTEALELPPLERFQTVLDIYTRGIERLADSELRPDIVVCCLSPEVVKACWSITNNKLTDEERRWLKRQQKSQAQNQGMLFDEWDIAETAEDLLFRDFRRALKARAMSYRMPIQIGTTGLFLDSNTNQDPATRAWNVSVALFYKSGGIPWRLKTDAPETCFIGISFHHLKTKQTHRVYSSIAQAFSTEGDGFALRGDTIPWSDEQGRNPHLSREQAGKLIVDVISKYREQMGRDPVRVVLHKTSKFNQAEQAGFTAALKHIPIIELVNLMPSFFRLVQRGAYPPKRGTICQINDAVTYLFTTGYIPEWGTYPGPHVPVPVKLIANHNADINRIAMDVLGLSRMNWNTASDTSGLPITLRFSREVGGIMAEVGANVQPNPSYRYYM